MQRLLLISKGNTEALCVTSGNRSRGVAVLTRRARVRWTERGGGGDTHMRCRLESTFRLVCPTSDRLHHFFIYFFPIYFERVLKSALSANEGMCVRVNRR